MKKIISLLLIFLIFSAGIAGANDNQPTIFVENVQIMGIGNEVTTNITLDDAPNGLSGYNITISLSNSSVANITSINFPSWATLHSNSTLPSSSVWIKAVDLNKQVEPGDTNVILATISLKSKNIGNSFINISATKIDDDEGYSINVTIQNATLKVVVNHPPDKPTNPNPSDDATGVSRTTDLSWTCSDPDEDNLTYDIYFGSSTNPPKVSANQTSTTYNPGTLNYETAYYWKIVAWDEHGAKNESNIWRFTTEGYVPPPPPENNPPTVSISNPSDRQTVSGMITINGSASDPDGNEELVKVEIKINDGSWITATGKTSWSYEGDTTTLENGNHTIFARSYDGEDYSATKSVTVKVFNNHPPVVNITSPINGSEINGTITITGNASDQDGNETLQKVEIKIDDGEWKNTNGTTSWNYTWDTTSVKNGDHTICAMAWDGNDYSSIDSIQIEVKNKKEEEGIPGFEFAFLIIAIAIILIKRKNKKNQ